MWQLHTIFLIFTCICLLRRTDKLWLILLILLWIFLRFERILLMQRSRKMLLLFANLQYLSFVVLNWISFLINAFTILHARCKLCLENRFWDFIENFCWVQNSLVQLILNQLLNLSWVQYCLNWILRLLLGDERLSFSRIYLPWATFTY